MELICFPQGQNKENNQIQNNGKQSIPSLRFPEKEQQKADFCPCRNALPRARQCGKTIHFQHDHSRKKQSGQIRIGKAKGQIV